MAAPAILVGFWLWGLVDRRISAQHASQYRPVPLSANPTFTPSRHVSVLCCTLNPEPTFLTCLRSWLENHPLEILLVTRAAHLSAVQTVLASCPSDMDTSIIRILVVPDGDTLPGFRGQLTHGIRHCRGSLIAKVDGHVRWNPSYLLHMVASFEDSSVGASGGDMGIFIDPSRQNPKDITPWEVAAAKNLFGARTTKYDVYAATKFRWIIAGGSVLYRAEIAQSEEFQRAFLNDIWHTPRWLRLWGDGKTRLDSGDDTFISRWVARQGFVNAVQQLPETKVLRVPKRTGAAWWTQFTRWERSSLQSQIRSLWEVPQIRQNPYVLRKSIERVLRDWLALIQLVAWCLSMVQRPGLTLLLLAYYVLRMIKSYQKFFAEYPYMRRHWWAAVLADYTALLVAPRVWWTIGLEEWCLGEKAVAKD